MTSFAAFRIGEMVSEMSMRRPSLDDPHRLEMLDAFTANDSLEDLAPLHRALGRDEHGNRLPDSLLRRVSKQPLSPVVPRQNDALQRLADDGVVG